MQDNANNVVKVVLNVTLLLCVPHVMIPTTSSLSMKEMIAQVTLSSKFAHMFSVQKVTEWMMKIVSVCNVMKVVSSVPLITIAICVTMAL